MKISEDALLTLHEASHEGVSLAMERVATSLPADHWLRRGHRYRRRGGLRGGDNKVRSDLSGGTISGEALAEYIGIGAPLHVVDGWAFLGRSIHCLLRGDPYTAVHFAYYAELRAALGLLASQGIGIFSNRHAIVTKTGMCSLVEPESDIGTRLDYHLWVWLVFQWWADQPEAIQLLGDIIRPSQENLQIWMETAERSRLTLDFVGKSLLRTWGIDLGRFFADRDARNAASYWPNTLNAWQVRGHKSDLEAVLRMWQLLEPSAGSRFLALDRELLRAVLKAGYFAVTGKRSGSASGRQGFETEIAGLLTDMGMSGLELEGWKALLVAEEGQTRSVLTVASGNAKVGDASHVEEVMARAVMLLRLATGAAETVLREAGLERERLEFWIESVGTDRGLWEEGQSPQEITDLWAEVEDKLEDVGDWLEGPERSGHTTWSGEPRTVAVLGECERVALWGLGL